MISKIMQDAINDQIQKELYSSYLYLSMAAYFEDRNLSGFSHWMRVQESEEREHAMKLYDFLLERGVLLYEFGVVMNKCLDDRAHLLVDLEPAGVAVCLQILALALPRAEDVRCRAWDGPKVWADFVVDRSGARSDTF